VANDERGVVLDARPGPYGTDEVVHLLPRRPRRTRAEAELLVERADRLDDAASEEDREGDSAIPEVVVGEERALVLPRGTGGTGRIHRSTGEARQAGIRVESLRDPREQSRRIDTVVVGKRDEVGVDERKPRVACTREAEGAPDPLYAKRPPADDRVETRVLVLVHDDDAHGGVLLNGQRVEEACELVRAPHRRDNEVERRRGLRHAP
jgi:hypothetical protein